MLDFKYMKDTVSFIFIVPCLFLLTLYLSQFFYQCPSSVVLVLCLVISLLLSWRLRSYVRTQGIIIKCLFALLSLIAALFLLVLLISLNESRSLGKDARVMQTISPLRAHAEIYMTNVGSYKNFCNSPEVQQANDIILASKTSCYGPIVKYFLGSKEQKIAVTCNATDTKYAVDAYLPNQQKYFCIDDIGQAKAFSRSLGTQTRCQE